MLCLTCIDVMHCAICISIPPFKYTNRWKHSLTGTSIAMCVDKAELDNAIGMIVINKAEP